MKISKNLTDFFIYSLGNVITNVVGFISIYFFTRIMEVGYYEDYLRFGFIYSLTHSFFSFQGTSVIPVFYSQDKDVLSVALWIQAIGYSIGYFVLYFCFRGMFEYHVALILIHAIAYTMSMSVSIYFNQKGQALMSILWQSAHPLLLFCSFIVYSNYDNTAVGRIYAGSVASLVVLIFIIVFYLRRIRLNSKFFEKLKYCLPLIGHVFMGITVGGFYKLLGRENPIAEISIYFSVILLFLAISDVLYQYFQPRFYRALDENISYYENPILKIFMVSFFLGLVFFFSAPIIVDFMVPVEFRLDNRIYLGLLFVILTAQISYRFLLGYLQYFKKSLSVLKISFISTLLFFIFVLVDISLFSYLVSLVLFYIANAIGLIYALKRVHVL